MIEIKIEGKKFQIPGGMEEVTVKQYHEMTMNAEDLNPVRVLSILTGLQYDAINNFDCTGFVENVLPALNWLKDPVDIGKLPRREFITIGAKQIAVIKDPGKERVGQKLRMTQIVNAIKGTVNEVPGIIPSIVANYYAPYIHEKGIWEENHVDEVEKMIWHVPLFEVAPECGFFLSGWIKSSRSKR